VHEDKTERPLREWLREMSAARRAVRALTDKYGETRYYGTLAEVERRRKRYEEWEASVRLELPASARLVNLPERLTGKLMRLQGRRCYLCDGRFTATARATQDHVVPRARGGKNARNILLAHQPCNNAKGDREPTWRELAYLRAINERLYGAQDAVAAEL
jgi:5-methylcytosine-specific restriction endonuclease McrA